MTEFEPTVKVDWQSIKTAPKDGRWFILWRAAAVPSVDLCRWTKESDQWQIKHMTGLAESLAYLGDTSGTKHYWIPLEAFMMRAFVTSEPNREIADQIIAHTTMTVDDAEELGKQLLERVRLARQRRHTFLAPFIGYATKPGDMVYRIDYALNQKDSEIWEAAGVHDSCFDENGSELQTPVELVRYLTRKRKELDSVDATVRPGVDTGGALALKGLGSK